MRGAGLAGKEEGPTCHNNKPVEPFKTFSKQPYFSSGTVSKKHPPAKRWMFFNTDYFLIKRFRCCVHGR
jgi:hypothetical protein